MNEEREKDVDSATESLRELDKYEDALTEIIDELTISSIISPDGKSIDNDVIRKYSVKHTEFKNYTYGDFKNSNMSDEAAADVKVELTNVINGIPASSIISRSDKLENTEIIQNYIETYGDMSIDHIHLDKDALEYYKRFGSS